MRIYDKYKELWMRRFVKKNTRLSEVIFLSNELTSERIVSIVTEWEIHGIKLDDDDVWMEDIPTDVVPADVLNSISNDDLYVNRMFHHDLSKNSPLFYGLPVGTRLPSNVPEVQVGLEQAEKELLEAAGNLEDHYGDQGMEDLGKLVNQYLRAMAMNKVTESTNS